MRERLLNIHKKVELEIFQVYGKKVFMEGIEEDVNKKLSNIINREIKIYKLRNIENYKQILKEKYYIILLFTAKYESTDEEFEKINSQINE